MIVDYIDLQLTGRYAGALALAKQHDNLSRCIIATLYDGDEVYEVPKSAEVTVNAIKADDTRIYNLCEVIEHEGHNVVKFVLTNQMLAVAGDLPCEIRIKQGESILSSVKFVIDVQGSTFDDNSVLSKSEQTALEKTRKEIEENTNKTVENSKKAQQDARQADEAAQKAAEEVKKVANVAEATSIIPTASGERIGVGDSAESHLRGLRVYSKSIRERESIQLRVCGKNLTQLEPREYKIEESYYTTEPQPLIQNVAPGKYVLTVELSVNFAGNSNGWWFKAGYGESSYSRDLAISQTQGGNGLRLIKMQIDIGDDVAGQNIYIRPMSVATTNTATITVSKIALTLVDDEIFAPYHDGGTLTIPYKLHGTPVDSGGNYTDSSGQEWISDYVDFERGIVVIDGKEEPIEPQLVEQYKELKTLYPYTTVLNDKGAGMELDYQADTKLYIDNKFNQLQNAILSTGGNI